ncbi:hypothetical protein COL940_009087 [Colletotrichum noveboracense]|nr:hypothetical protein COL940_009087 [Colletotrichum noveboracense]
MEYLQEFKQIVSGQRAQKSLLSKIRKFDAARHPKSPQSLCKTRNHSKHLLSKSQLFIKNHLVSKVRQFTDILLGKASSLSRELHNHPRKRVLNLPKLYMSPKDIPVFNTLIGKGVYMAKLLF